MVASNAGAFHSSACRHGPRLSGAELSFCMDAFINVHTRVQVAVLLPPADTDAANTATAAAAAASAHQNQLGLPNDTPCPAAARRQCHILPAELTRPAGHADRGLGDPVPPRDQGRRSRAPAPNIQTGAKHVRRVDGWVWMPGSALAEAS